MSVGPEFFDRFLKQFQVDQTELQPEEGGFSWLVGPFRQHLTVDKPFVEEGIEVVRVHARTDLIRNFRADGEQLARLKEAMQESTLNGYVRRDDDPTRIQLACSVYVNPSTAVQAPRLFNACALLQLATAVNLYRVFEHPFELDLHENPSPRDEERMQILQGLSFTLALRDSGQPLDRRAELREALKVCAGPPCVLSNGGDVCVVAEFPFLGRTSLAVLETRDQHPDVGRGLLSTLQLPTSFRHPVLDALELNERELRARTRAHFMGSWCVPPDGTPTYASFMPSHFLMPGFERTCMESTIMRALWVAEAVYGDNWANGGYETALAHRLGRRR